MRPHLAILAASFAAAGCAGPDPESAARETADAYVRAIGGREALLGLPTLHTLDSVYMAGLAGTSESWWIRDPFAGRISMRIGPVSQDLLISGDSVWSVDRNGALAAGDEVSRSQAALARMTVFQDAFLDPGGAGLTAGPDTVIGGERATPLTFEACGLPVTYYISRGSGLPLLMRTEAMGLSMISMPEGYRESGGILFPSSTRDSIPALGQVTRSASILVECGLPIPDSVFMVASGSGDASLPLPGTPHGFELDGGHIYLRGSVCGSEVVILLDSGAGATVLDERVAADLGLTPMGEFSAVGVGGTESFGFAAVPEYEALGATVTGQTLPLMDLDEAFYPSTGRHIGMILGYDFLSRFVTCIDYGSATVALYDAARWSPAPGSNVLPAGKVMSLLVIGAVLEDSVPVRLVLDTGAGGALHFSDAFLDSHPSFLEGRGTSEVMVEGVGGTRASLVFSVDRITLGSCTVPAGLCGSLGDMPVVSSCDGVIGSEVLARFEVSLDYGTPSVVLEPSSLFQAGLPGDPPP